jgi:hypothetical protein
MKSNHFSFGEKLPKGDTTQIFWWKSLFFLKSIHQSVPLFKDQVVTCMLISYIFNFLEKCITIYANYDLIYMGILVDIMTLKKWNKKHWQRDDFFTSFYKISEFFVTFEVHLSLFRHFQCVLSHFSTLQCFIFKTIVQSF